MTDYNYINLAVHGQFDGETKTVYTYPSSQASVWDNILFDPTQVIKNFLNARECYVLRSNISGHYFSLITRNPLEVRTGYLLLTLRLDNGYSLTGRQIVNTLSSLKKTLIEDGDRFDDAVTRCLEAVGIPRAGVRLDSWTKTVGTAQQAADTMCYRTYVSGQELETILSFPDQTDYSRYDKVIVIQATASLRPGQHIDRITTPVKKIFSLVLPEGVMASKMVVNDGERVQLTYTKAGYNSRTESIIAGVPSPYVRYEGSAIRVKSPKESGMSFVRRVKLVVKSAKGGLVTGYTINVNGRPINTMEPYIELSEHEMTPGGRTEINVASNNYRPLKVVKDTAALAAMETLELVLEPMEQGIKLRLDFGEGRIFEQTISIEKNTPEYSQLHSGNFHGFRAHRLTTPGGAEVYNVDCKASSRPAAPVFENVATPAEPAQQKPAAPAFENVSQRSDVGQHRPVAPVFENVSKNPGAALERDDNSGSKNKGAGGGFKLNLGGNNLGYILGAVLAVAIIVLAFIFILPGGTDKAKDGDGADSLREATSFSGDPAELSKEAADKAAEEAKATETKPEETKAEEPKTEEPAAAAPAAEDTKYLNDAAKWEVSKVSSASAKELMTAFQSGNIDAVVNNPYFKGGADNKTADKIATMLWKAKGTNMEKKNIEVMKKYSTAESINLKDMYEDLARIQPAKAEANKEARPK